jgi:hypothetical protein
VNSTSHQAQVTLVSSRFRSRLERTLARMQAQDRRIRRQVPLQFLQRFFVMLSSEQHVERRNMAPTYSTRAKVFRTISVGAEICGHTFVDEMLYVLRGRENKDVPNTAEKWRIARLNPREEAPGADDLATIPFASRSLTHDGEKFWSNHRAASETISFTISP